MNSTQDAIAAIAGQIPLALEAAGIGTYDYFPESDSLNLDATGKMLLGFSPNETVAVGRMLENIFPEDRQPINNNIAELKRGIATEDINRKFRVKDPATAELRWLNSVGKISFNKEGRVKRVTGVIINITESESIRKAATVREDIALLALDSANIGWAQTDLRTQELTYSPIYAYLMTGDIEAKLTRDMVISHIHPDDDAIRQRLLKNAKNHKPFSEVMRLVWNDLSVHWIRFSGKFFFDDNDEPYLATTTVQDTTEESVQVAQTKASRDRLVSVINGAPAAMGLFIGRDLIVESPNEEFIKIVGKGPDIAGKPLREVMPELLTENQPFLQILDDVYTSGKTFQSFGSQVKIVQNGVMTANYYNITYSPLRNQKGEIYGILDIAVDVTGEILTREKLELNEKILQSAVEVAELALWSVDLETGKISLPEKLKSWLGLSGDATMEEAMALVADKENSAVGTALNNAFKSDGNGMFDEEISIKPSGDRGQRIIHIQGLVVFDENKKPFKMSGIARDITAVRELQVELEQEVKKRTNQLSDKNDELAEMNTQLQRSNEELSQYAYVASHDLQEPLRKIRVYSNMMEAQEELTEDSRGLLAKINSSAVRMSGLIEDLLNFSKLLMTEMVMRPVNLNDLLRLLRKDFDLVIEEKGAKFHVGDLPVIDGVLVQLTQLFHNLISNALKFSVPERRPELTVIAMRLTHEQAVNFIPEADKEVDYSCISFSDNGIGFDEEYAVKIFEIFKRLHGKTQYAGSGIGLAVCKRVVTNHGGYIYANSKPGEGATFFIILPEKQPHANRHTIQS